MWLKLDAAFYGHPKVVLAGRDARDIFGASLCWSAFYTTDGFLPAWCLARLAADAAGGDGSSIDAPAAAQRLVAVGLWEKTPGGYQIHDYLKHQTARARIKAIAKKRAQAGAIGGVAERKQNGSKTEANEEATVEQPSNTSPPNGAANEPVESRTKNIELISPAPLPPAPPAPDPEARGPEPTPMLAFPKPHELERAATESHPLYEPLVTLFGKPPARDLPSWRDDITALEEMGATPEDVPIAAEAYTAIMGDDNGRPIPRTRAALIRHWHRCLQAASYPEDVSHVTGGYAPHEAPIVAWSRRQGYAP
jgi:hypothetical protein